MNTISKILNKFPKSWRVPGIIALILTLFNVPVKFDKTSEESEQANIRTAIQQVWVDSIFQSMTVEEKIGQLMMVRAYSNKDAGHERVINEYIEKYHVGGVIFFQGHPKKQAELTNSFQSKAKIPLMIAIDAEWGLGMRLKEHTISFPKQLTLGAIKNNKLIYDMGKEVASHCRRLGIHLNFAPVVDINNNPDNPVINTRSFGEDRYNVTAKSYMYARGMQDHGVMACAKHFPGHGDTNVDSHHDLPIIPHDYNRLDSVEFYPFKILAQNGIQSMMMGHLSIPSLDSTKNLASSLSPKIVTGLLKEKFGYSGLLFTDGLDMKGVSKFYNNGRAEVQALKAGNDILLLPQSVPKTVTAVTKALETGELTQDFLDAKVRKVLRAKHRLKLDELKEVELEGLMADLNSLKSQKLKEKLIENAITVVRNPGNLVPFVRLDSLSFASVAIGASNKTTFQDHLGKYAAFDFKNFGKEVTNGAALIKKLKKKKVVVVSLHDMSSKSSSNFGVSASARKFINDLSKETKVVLTVFGSPYSLKYFEEVDHVVVGFDDDKTSQAKTAQALFGAIATGGRLPVTAGPRSKFGDGVDTKNLRRLVYTTPEFAGMDSEKLKEVDKIAKEAVRIKATPGCQILVVKDGKVIYQKSFGHHSYLPRTKVKNSDIYDLASVTKVASTTLSVMKLQEQKKLDVTKSLGKYFSKVKGTNKEKLIIQDVMAHHAGLKSWIPFYEETITKKYKRPKKSIYSSSKKEKFSVQVANNLYIDHGYRDTIWNRIFRSDLRSTTKYRYSDLGFYMLKKMVEVKAEKPIQNFINEEFYAPLGLQTLTYRPLDKFPKSRIVPSERDNYFRHQILVGHVHDMGAAMMGGVSGHAGLFGNSNDLAILMQMLLNEGEYGGVRYFQPETIKQFTTRQKKSTRRAIGFDMKEANRAKDPNIAVKSSDNTFGHTGFTGVGVWADPDNDLIFIFISNRTYPSMNNWKLNKKDIRLRMHDAIYDAIIPPKEEELETTEPPET